MHSLRAAWTACIAGLVASAAVVAPVKAADDAPTIYGVWRNPKDSVHLDIRACGAGTCGYVVWASAKAQADARKGSGKDLVGQQLFRNFTPDGPNIWRGHVFVPDVNKTFSGSAEVMDAQTLKAKGCLIGGLFCKSQFWKRVRPVAD